MDHSAYLKMAEVEEKHWWFVGRRKIILSTISRMKLGPNAKILEVGCGTGGNLSLLSEFGSVYASEFDTTALKIAQDKTKGAFDIRSGGCPDAIPFDDQIFDLICMFDVLEHIDEDVRTLSNLKKLLHKNGRIIITVPAYQWMWSSHDDFLHHKRRYSAKLMREHAQLAGFKIHRLSYFNTFMFPLAFLARFLPNSATKGASQMALSPAPINSLFTSVFQCERHLLSLFNLPYGLSLLAILET